MPLIVTSVMGYLNPPRGSPTQTAAASCGVNPANQIAALSLVLPVLPAAGRSVSDIAEPVRPSKGPSMTLVSTAVTVSATSRLMTSRHRGSGTSTWLPYRSVISRTTRGLQ